MGSKRERAISNSGATNPLPPAGSDAPSQAPVDSAVAFHDALDAALNADDIRRARCVVAEEEVRQMQGVDPVGGTSRAEIAAAKARIALATDDGPAARAILVSAIEAAPENRSLRVLMSEVMLATGRAAEVRPLLTHLGKHEPDASHQTPPVEDAS